MIGDFDTEKFKILSDSNTPRMTAKLWEDQILHYGFDISHESFKKYRQGKAKPSGAVIYAMSKILGVHYFDLLEGLEAPKRSELDKKFEKLSDNDKEMILGMIERMIND
jgi:transcriptional regulator with XRE-family HTH domain